MGTSLIVIGVIHTLLTPLLYPEAWRSVIEAGVLGSIEADEATKDLRSAGFWYATAGLSQVMFGSLVVATERRVGVVPRGPS
ncbi:hypothetical protein BH24ACT15_BH24ACT15_17560 [soil metagenome]